MGVFNLRLTMGDIWNKIPNINQKHYQFDSYSIGVDCDNGSKDHKVFLFCGYKINKNNEYDKYLIK